MMHRRWWAGAGVTGAALVLGATTVFACTSLSTLNLSQASGAPGSQISVTGSSFGTAARGNGPVTLHWNSVDGPVLASNIVPDASGAIGPVTVTIPGGVTNTGMIAGTTTVTPGYYTIIATQTGKDGQPAFGTPARAAFQVTGTSSGAANQVPAGPSASSLTGSTAGLGTGVIALLVGLGVAGLLLFGLGAATFVGSSRRVASASRVRKP